MCRKHNKYFGFQWISCLSTNRVLDILGKLFSGKVSGPGFSLSGPQGVWETEGVTQMGRRIKSVVKMHTKWMAPSKHASKIKISGLERQIYMLFTVFALSWAILGLLCVRLECTFCRYLLYLRSLGLCLGCSGLRL